MACERTSETINNTTKNAGKVAQWPRYVPFQPTASGKFESFGSGTSGNDVDNQSAMSGRQIKD